VVRAIHRAEGGDLDGEERQRKLLGIPKNFRRKEKV